VTYRIEIDPPARDQIRAMPHPLQKRLAEVMAMLELTPWHCEPINKNNPTGSVRQLAFGDNGRALLTFLILERQRLVDVLEVLWLD
jgi:hypothetical protein